MKIYDKEIYNKQKNISSVVTILVAFFIGFAGGYLANSATEKHNVQNDNNVVSSEINNISTQNKTMEE